jgi:hypothetical protein
MYVNLCRPVCVLYEREVSEDTNFTYLFTYIRIRTKFLFPDLPQPTDGAQ